MLPRFTVWLDTDTIALLESLRKPDRKALLVFVRSLMGAPFQKGDFVENGERGREVQVKVLGDYSVSWWIDFPVKEIKVEEIRKADG